MCGEAPDLIDETYEDVYGIAEVSSSDNHRASKYKCLKKKK
jgi:hypothetical protein